MAMFTTTSRRFTRNSDYNFGGGRNLRARSKPGLEVLPAARSRSGAEARERRAR